MPDVAKHKNHKFHFGDVRTVIIVVLIIFIAALITVYASDSINANNVAEQNRINAQIQADKAKQDAAAAEERAQEAEDALAEEQNEEPQQPPQVIVEKPSSPVYCTSQGYSQLNSVTTTCY